MKNHSSGFALLFAVVMLAFVLFLAWYIPSVARLRFQIEDLTISLDTSHGRERKQQAEYDQVVRDIPDTKALLEEKIPMAEAAKAEVDALKAEKKQLREQKKALEAASAEAAEETAPAEAPEEGKTK